jgi:hypothetical protein
MTDSQTRLPPSPSPTSSTTSSTTSTSSSSIPFIDTLYQPPHGHPRIDSTTVQGHSLIRCHQLPFKPFPHLTSLHRLK